MSMESGADMVAVAAPLKQHEQIGLAGPGLPDQPDRLPRLDTKAEFVEYLKSTGITKRNVVEGDGRAALYQRLRFGVVAQFVRKQQRGNSFGQPGDMLGDIDQRDGEIARGTQNGKSQRTNQHDVTGGGGGAALPKHDRPSQ